MSYISREAAIKACKNIQQSFMGEYNDPDTVEYIGECIEAIERLPSAQPEIIRCKDCKWYEIWQLKSDYTDDKRCKPSVCVRGRYAVHRSEDWYCADAERRTDE